MADGKRRRGQGSSAYPLALSRTVIVGDVHGCADELAELLARVGLMRSDRLIFVGDVVARGPSSLSVLALFREHAASGVLGNHEWRVLEARRARRNGERGPRLGPDHERLLAELGDADWALIEGWPRYLVLESLGLLVVHAGVLPGRPLEAQDPFDLLHMRTVDESGRPSVKRRFTQWGSLYDGPQHIVFGHNALDGLQLHAHATGIDTACVYGGELTALVLDDRYGVPPLEERRRALVSVPSRRRYFRG